MMVKMVKFVDIFNVGNCGLPVKKKKKQLTKRKDRFYERKGIKGSTNSEYGKNEILGMPSEVIEHKLG